jgi:hypothetical protein
MVATGGFRSRVRVASLTAAIALALAGAGCSGGTDDHLPPAQTPTPTPSPTPTLDPEDAAAYETVEGYLRTFTAVLTEAEEPEALAAYTTEHEVELLDRDIQANRRDGIIFTGVITFESMQIVDRDQAPGPTESAAGPGLLVEACLDGGDWRLVDRTSGHLVGPDPDEGDTRHIGRFLVFPMDDGGWWTRFTVPEPQWVFGFEEEHLDPC